MVAWPERRSGAVEGQGQRAGGRPRGLGAGRPENQGEPHPRPLDFRGTAHEALEHDGTGPDAAHRGQRIGERGARPARQDAQEDDPRARAGERAPAAGHEEERGGGQTHGPEPDGCRHHETESGAEREREGDRQERRAHGASASGVGAGGGPGSASAAARLTHGRARVAVGLARPILTALEGLARVDDARRESPADPGQPRELSGCRPVEIESRCGRGRVTPAGPAHADPRLLAAGRGAPRAAAGRGLGRRGARRPGGLRLEPVRDHRAGARAIARSRARRRGPSPGARPRPPRADDRRAARRAAGRRRRAWSPSGEPFSRLRRRSRRRHWRASMVPSDREQDACHDSARAEGRAPPRVAPDVGGAGCLPGQTGGSRTGTDQTRAGARRARARTPAQASAKTPTIT